jgi:hypothetical protein
VSRCALIAFPDFGPMHQKCRDKNQRPEVPSAERIGTEGRVEVEPYCGRPAPQEKIPSAAEESNTSFAMPLQALYSNCLPHGVPS